MVPSGNKNRLTELSDISLGKLTAAAVGASADGRYQLQGELGRGGMGVVYQGRDILLDRAIAIKVVHDTTGASHTALTAALEAEAKILAGLDHSGIVPVLDAGVLSDGRWFYVMKLVEGLTFDELVAGDSDLDQRLSVLERVADTVGMAHDRGIVHRDLSPANIMTGSHGEVTVMDWGLAEYLTRSTRGGVVGFNQDRHSGLKAGRRRGGTVGFASPEQRQGCEPDPSADVYALGALLVFAITKLRPGPGDSAESLLNRYPGVPNRLKAIASKCLSGVPADRYSTAGEVAGEIRRWRTGGQVLAYREGLGERVVRLFTTHRTAIVLVAAYLVMRTLIALSQK